MFSVTLYICMTAKHFRSLPANDLLLTRIALSVLPLLYNIGPARKGWLHKMRWEFVLRELGLPIAS